MAKCKICKKTKLNLVNRFTCSHCKKEMCMTCRFPETHKCKEYTPAKVKLVDCNFKKVSKI